MHVFAPAMKTSVISEDDNIHLFKIMIADIRNKIWFTVLSLANYSFSVNFSIFAKQALDIGEDISE